ncbi:MAG: carbohydrate ABC transporter permease, partial [Proteobacteria bacterium]
MRPVKTPALWLLAAFTLSALYLFPLYWMYITAVKGQTEIFVSPPTFWPNEFDFSVYPYVWETRNVPSYMWNSLVIASGATGLAVVFGTGCAYVLARYRTVWVDIGLFLILMLQVLPASVMVTPLFVGFNQIGLLGWPRTAVVLAVAAKTMPFFVVLVRAAFMSIPRELEEAGLV